MTVEELIKELQQFDPHAKVMFAYDYGDHCNSIVAEVAEIIDEQRVVFSDYHNQYKIVEDNMEGEHAVVIRG